MKAIHILDERTDIRAAAFRMGEAAVGNDSARAILGEAGFGRRLEDQDSYVILVQLSPKLRSEFDPFEWPDPTMTAAHLWLLEHLDELPNGGALDAQPLREALIAAGRS